MLATPDGAVPQLDINGLSLSFHAVDKLGEAAATVADAAAQPGFDLATYRQRNAALARRRDEEIALALRLPRAISPISPAAMP